ncbi:MAG: response regulator [Ardenticatenia bacterium]|nr:response regulator [Ardenticatenia bacterium]
MARILVVDDEPDVLEYSCQILRALGHEVEAVASAERALLRLQYRTFDVVLTDYSLPGLNGLELAQMIKKRSPATLVGVISGWESPEQSRQTGVDQAVDFVLPKPFTLRDMKAVLSSRLR